jgi:hypothetical protein
MSLRFYNPPRALLARGNPEGADIGGTRSIIAMDKKHNLRVVEHIYSELSWAEYWKEPELKGEIENLTLKEMDDAAVYDNRELIKRISNAITKVRKNNWIFFGIAGFESNTFKESFFIDVPPKLIQKLEYAHAKIRSQNRFPVLLKEHLIQTTQNFISIMFHGNGRQYFHIPNDQDLFITNSFTEELHGYAAGIVCTAQEAANFYIINENYLPNGPQREIHTNVNLLEDALAFIEHLVIFPVSWFFMDIGITSLETLDKWEEIREDEQLRHALDAYQNYLSTTLQEEHERRNHTSKVL